MSTTVEGVLWLTVPGASAGAALGWLAWVGGAALAAPLLVDRLGAAGAVLVIVAAGWVLARHAPAPVEWLRRYHLDDAEVTAIGPGARVRRLPWSSVETLTQERRWLRVEGGGMTVTLPLHAILRGGAFGAVLARVVPEQAGEMWALLEEGEELRLAPRADPAARALALWGYLPALPACVAGAGGAGLAVAVGLAVAERAAARLLAWAGRVTLDRSGVTFRRRGRAIFLPWPRAEVMRAPRGLLVGVKGSASDLVTSALPNFWAAAPVIDLKARLGPYAGARVHFRVRLADGGPAVVGEVDPTA